jgi:hypothetical protein
MPRVVGSKAIGYLCETSEGRIVRECDTFTCRHCNRIVPVPPNCRANDMPGGTCWGCRGLVCTRCYDKGGCDHIEKKLERQERLGRWHRQYDDTARR